MQVYHDPSHEEVIRLIRSKKNLFLTGPGGVGKSTLVRRLSQEITDIAITAMTGCAALLLDCKATTLHSWAGIGLGMDSIERTIESIRKKAYVKKRWLRTGVLVIDEVSMMSPGLFEFLDGIGRAIRKVPTKPFGGIQLVLVGDFCQLPPVMKDEEVRFVFESELWPSVIKHAVVLNKIWRQADPVYQTVLNEARMGRLSSASEAILRSRMGTNWQSELIKPTVLFSLNKDVDKVNLANLQALEGETRRFRVKTVYDMARWREENGGRPLPEKNSDLVNFAVDRLDKDAPYLPEVELRVGAQVMLITNLDMALGRVNGSRGIILEFEDIRGYPVVKFRNGARVTIEPHIWYSTEVPCIGREQMPLKIAYAISIHKSQGASIDTALVDIGKSTFEYGQAYTALSRVRSLEGLHIHAIDPQRIRAHPRVLKFYKALLATADLVPIPVAEFGSAAESEPVSVPVPEPVAPEPTLEPVEEPWDLSCVHPSWLPCLERSLTPELKTFVLEARRTKTVYPPVADVFRALSLDMNEVKVVILGQDPYHGPGQAMGLSFSVPDGVACPPSLKNILKEVRQDLGVESVPGNLTSWFKQGVLLLNAVLTVEAGQPNSHASSGWERVTDALLTELASKRKGIVFLLWGKFAQKKAKLLGSGHIVLMAAHPSPLSAYAGFFGSKHFSQCNAALGEKAIRWAE
jgi:ATP-dependent DNA helicase PIF1